MLNSKMLHSSALLLVLVQGSLAFAPNSAVLGKAGFRYNLVQVSTPRLRAPALRMQEYIDVDALPAASFKKAPQGQRPPPPPPPQQFVPPTAAPPKAAAPGIVPQGAVRAAPSAFIDDQGYMDPGASQQEQKKNTLAAVRLQNPDLVGMVCPDSWVENRDFIRQGRILEGQLVMVARSDGTTRFGEVARKSGFFWQDLWEVIVTTKPNGAPGATRVEEGVMLGRPTPAAMAAFMSGEAVVQGNSQMAPPPPPPKAPGDWI